jgi:hypothetical protein
MKSLLILSLFCAAFAGPAMAACAPASIVHIVTTETTPGIDPDSADAKPKNLFRQGSNRSRLEEQPDALGVVQAMAVIDEPNIWLANLADRKGRHFFDPSAAPATRAAVFSDDRIAPKILDLEFGCEAAWVAANAPKVDRVEAVDGVKLDVHRFVDGIEAAEILEKPGSSDPAFARYYRSGKMVWVIRYDLYDANAPSDPDMFKAPAGVTYEDIAIKP